MVADYDFKTLSSVDFEYLVRDLLQKQFGIYLETFKSGRDSGIDLRYSQPNDKSFIIQCKHYANTPYSTLISQLKNIELPKVENLNPQKYILTTSIGLTPNNKNEILDIFRNYCPSTQDIYGKDDLNNLLGMYPDIEKQHHKLWLTSSAVLERLVHAWIYNQTEDEVERIKKEPGYMCRMPRLVGRLKY